MRILMLNYEFPPLGGGAAPVSYELAKAYVEQGHIVDVITMHYKGLPFYEKKDEINIYRVKCLRSKKEICYPWEQLTYIFSAKQFLKQHLKNNQYDINHTHFLIPTGIISFWLKKKYKLSYIITSHGSDVPGYNPDRFVFLHKFTKPLLKQVCQKAKLITVPSIYLKQLIQKQLGDYRIIIIPNGSKDYLDSNIKKENIIVSAGRLLPRKGFQYLIKAFNKLDNNNWKLYIVGDGPYKKELIRLSKKNKNIIFTSWLDNSKEQYKKIINKSKIFCSLSSFESQGIALIEAMSTGCAIICSSIPVFKDSVSINNGFFVKREDINEIMNKLNTLINDKNLVSKFSKNSRIKYEKNFKYKNIIKNYIYAIS